MIIAHDSFQNLSVSYSILTVLTELSDEIYSGDKYRETLIKSAFPYYFFGKNTENIEPDSTWESILM